MILLVLAILLPVLGGLAMPFLSLESEKKRGVWVEAVVITTSILVWCAILMRKSGSITIMHVMQGLDLTLHLDGMSCVFAGLVSVLWPLASLYGFEYMRHEERPTTFFTFYTMTYGVTLAIAFSANLFTMYVFYECLTMITMPLVLHKKDTLSVRASRKYLTYSVSGAALGLIALVVSVWYGTGEGFVLGGSIDMSRASGVVEMLRFVFVLAFIGFGTKAAVFPMYAWLPAASVAPTPVTALLHAVAVVNSGAFAVTRVIYYVFGTQLLYGTWAQTLVMVFACVTILFGSGMAVKEQHFKRRLAFSTISNLSYMLMGAALMTPDGMVGDLTHMIFHGVIKITLFYCAGAILVRTGKEYVQDLRGYSKIMPFTCAVYVFASVALVGIPPLCGFVSKWNLLIAAGHNGTVMGIVAIFTLIASAILTAMYLFGVAMPMYFRPLNEDQAHLKNRDPGWMMKLPFVFLCVAMLALGIFSGPLVSFLRGVANGLIF